MKFLQVLLLIILFYSCNNYKQFYDNPTSKKMKIDNRALIKEMKTYEKQKNKRMKIYGSRSNKLLRTNIDYDPNILKTNYMNMVATILLENSPKKFDYEKLNYDQYIYVDMYFSTKDFKPKEVYFVTFNTNLFSIFPEKNIEKIEKEIKNRVVAEKNPNRLWEGEVDRQLDSLDYVQHSIGFSVKQLFLIREGKLPLDKLIYR